jgi:rRNA maturation RNase YbeY
MMQISMQNRQRTYPVNRRNILKWARQILSLQKLHDAEMGIILVNDRQIRIYNREYRKKDRSTDVLSFPMREGVGGALHPHFLGDVMISLERSAEEAVLYRRSRREQLLILLIHGTLHLLGYDHERSRKEERRMQRRERFLFKRIYCKE